MDFFVLSKVKVKQLRHSFGQSSLEKVTFHRLVLSNETFVPETIEIISLRNGDLNGCYTTRQTLQISIEHDLVCQLSIIGSCAVSSLGILTVNDYFHECPLFRLNPRNLVKKIIQIFLKNHWVDRVSGEVVQTALKMLASQSICKNNLSELIGQ